MMKIGFAILLLLLVSSAFAQDATPTPSAQDIENQIADVGCRAERQAASTTIVNLQKQIAELKEQLAKAKSKVK